MRPSDELWISIELAQQFLGKGHRVEYGIEVTEGPDPQAQILSVKYRPEIRMIVIKYDRDVPEPAMRQFTLEPNRIH